MKTICRNRQIPWPVYETWGKGLICLSFTIILLMASIGIAVAGKEDKTKVDVRNYCIQSRQNQCKAGMPVLEKLIVNMGASDDGPYTLWDAKPSDVLKDFWHLIYTDHVANQRVIVYSDGENLVPVVLPVVPGRDIENITDEKLEKNPNLKRAVANERTRRESGVKQVPLKNKIPLEQNGMYIGRVDVRKLVEEKKAFEIIKGRKGYGYALVADNLFQPDMVDILDGIRHKNPNYEFYLNKTIYFLPTFSFINNPRTGIIGKYFYALVENGMDPGHAAYALAKLSPSGKVNMPTLREYCLSLIGQVKREEFLKSLTNVNSDYPAQGALMDLGVISPKYHIINGQLFHGI